MSSLADAVQEPQRADAIVKDCLLLLEEEVGAKKGVSGLGIKAGFKAVKNAKPGFLEAVVRHLLPEFTAALDPIYEDALAEGSDVHTYFTAHAGRVADGLLAITDRKADASGNTLLKGAYNKLRGIAKKHVEQAVPRLADLVKKHAATIPASS